VSGEIIGGSGSGKVAHAFVTYSGCTFESKTCTTTGQASGVLKSGELEGELGYLSETKMGEVGLLLKPKSGAFMSCKDPYVVEFKGGLIGQVTSPVNKMAKEFGLGYHQSSGLQEITKFAGGSNNNLQESYNKGEFEEAGIEAAAEVNALEGEMEIAETL
jgi:hypothetical protein